MDFGINTEFKVKLIPEIETAFYRQNVPMPIQLKDDLIVELALMQKYGIITVVPFSKYASPIFAKRRPNGKLCPLVDLRKINSLIVDDCTNNNHPVSTMSDAARHLAGKSLFCNLNCSQAYHSLQMAEQWSVNCLQLVSLAQPLPAKDLHNVLADLCFQVSCVSTWTQIAKLTNVLNKLTTLESQPKMLWTLPETIGQSSSALAKQD